MNKKLTLDEICAITGVTVDEIEQLLDEAAEKEADPLMRIELALHPELAKTLGTILIALTSWGEFGKVKRELIPAELVESVQDLGGYIMEALRMHFVDQKLFPDNDVTMN